MQDIFDIILYKRWKMDNQKLLELQKLFSEGRITEDDIPEEYIDELEKLYKKQIEDLDNEIEKSKQTIREKLDWLKKNNK